MFKKNRIEKTYKKNNTKKVKKIIALVSLFVVPAAVIAGTRGKTAAASPRRATGFFTGTAVVFAKVLSAIRETFFSPLSPLYPAITSPNTACFTALRTWPLIHLSGLERNAQKLILFPTLLANHIICQSARA